MCVRPWAIVVQAPGGPTAHPLTHCRVAAVVCARDFSRPANPVFRRPPRAAARESVCIDIATRHPLQPQRK
eukprot:13789421-Heterocapsa_arctica.AAC.1